MAKKTGLKTCNIVGILLGASLMILGLVFVPFINHAADNWAAIVSPASVVVGVLLIIVSLAKK